MCWWWRSGDGQDEEVEEENSTISTWEGGEAKVTVLAGSARWEEGEEGGTAW